MQHYNRPAKAEEASGMIYGGCVLLGGALAGIYSVIAGRYTMLEMVLLIAGGVAAGVGLALLCNGVIGLLKKQ